MTDPRFLLDTNICIYLAEQSSPRLTNRLEECERGALVTSAIVYAEFVRGIDWTLPNAEQTLAALFDDIAILPFDAAAARQYSSLPFVRHRLDGLITAHALSLGLTLITANLRDFAAVEGLKVEDWTQ